MILGFIRHLYQYNAWANRRILDAAGRVNPSQLQAGTILSFGSVLHTLVHIMSAQWLWLNRWQGLSPTAMLDPGLFPDLESLCSHWEKLEQETRDFVFSCTEADLLGVGSYRNFRGEVWSYPLWQQMLHQANHATQHRSEAAVILSGWDCSPGSMDFLFFVDDVRSQNKPGG
jgi:uncharacterized damage-inducible protein DinB